MILQQILQLMDELRRISDDIHDGVYVYKNLNQFDLTLKQINTLLDARPSIRIQLKLTDSTAYAYLDYAEKMNSSFAQWPELDRNPWGQE